MLYEFWLNRTPEEGTERGRILLSMQETAARTLKSKLAEASFRYASNFRYETISPYLMYSLFQAAVIHYRLWRINHDAVVKHSFDLLITLLKDCKQRWLVAGKSSK
jgi:hypothetical protein